MQKTFSRTIAILCFLFLLAAAGSLCFVFSQTEVASAETVYNLGYKTYPIQMTYGDTVTDKVFNNKGQYFKVVNYVGSLEVGGAPVSLTSAGVVTADPDIYYMSAGGNAIPCEADGTPLEDARCEGVIVIGIAQKTLNVSLSAESLSKTYGETPESLPSVTVGDLTLTFTSAGIAADAAVGEYDDLSLYSVTRSGTPVENFETYYTLNVTNEETGSEATYTVLPKEILFTYDEEDDVRFNNYLIYGESVTYRTLVAPSGETLTAYFKIYQEHPATLTVGDSYAVELVRYVVTPTEGDPVTVFVTEKEDHPTQDQTVRYENQEESASNFTVAVTYEALTVKATAGSVVVYQDESLLAERENDPSYLYLPLSTFRYTYLDLIFSDKEEIMREGLILEQSVTFYPGVTGTVRFTMLSDLQDGTIPAGSYQIACRDYSCDEIESLSFDESVRLVVEKLKIDYEEKAQVQYPLTSSYSTQVTVSGYVFELTADLTTPVEQGSDEYEYVSASSVSDVNTELVYSKARLVLIKRTDGVSLVGGSEVTLSYGDEIGVLARPVIEIKGVSRELTQEGDGVTVSYSTAKLGNLLPTDVGTYQVTCSLVSERFSCDPLVVTVYIEKKKVAVRVQLSTDVKTYGTVFDFASNENVRISTVYPVDERGLPDLTAGRAASPSAFSGTALTSIGGLANAEVGDDYPFESSLLSGSYDVVKVLVYVGVGDAERQVTAFRVVKADRPATPSFSYEVKGRTIEVTVAGGFRLQVSKDQNMTAAEKSSGTDKITVGKFANKDLLYGEIFYLRVCRTAGSNYENDSEWGEVKEAILPFAAPALSLDEEKLTAESAEFTLDDPDSPAVVSGYVIRHRVGSGKWENGLLVTGLKEDTSYTVSFRLEKGSVVGAVATKTFRTKCAPVPKGDLKCSFDRESGTLSLSTERTGLEYRLCLPSGEEVVAWTDSLSFENLAADSKYLLQVRYSEASGKKAEITEIVIDTHKEKEPLTVMGVLGDWFLAIVGGGLLLLAVIFVAVFVKKKKRLDREVAEK